MQPPLQYHRELTDPSLAPFMGQYFQQLRHLYNTGVRWYTGVRTTDQYTALLRLDGINMHVKLLGKDVLYFEFASSGFPVVKGTWEQPPFSGSGYRGVAVGVDLRITKEEGNDVIKATPYIRSGKRYDRFSEVSKNKRSSQVQLADEPVVYPVLTPSTVAPEKRTYGTTLYEAWTPLHSHTGVYVTSLGTEIISTGTEYATDLGSRDSLMERDVGFDGPLAIGSGAGRVRHAYIRGNADWPRAAGLQLVTSAIFGTRTFGISIDAFNQVAVFPTSEIGPLNPDDLLAQTVPAKFVKMVEMPLPAWAYKPPGKAIDKVGDGSGGADWFVHYPDIDWKFSGDGKKCCAVVYRRELAVWDNAYYQRSDVFGPSATDPLPSWYGSTGIPGRFYDTAGSWPTIDGLYAVAPGLVEIKVKITLTGKKVEQFAVELVLTVHREPQSSTRCALVAGYAWYDVPALGVAAGDLLALDVERWYQPNEFIPDPSYPGPGNWTDGGVLQGAAKAGAIQYNFVTGQSRAFFSLRKVAASEQQVMRCTGDSLIACDLRTVSFVLGVEKAERVDRECALADGNEVFASVMPETVQLPHLISHPAVAIYVLGGLQEVMCPPEMADDTKAALAVQAALDPMAGMDETWTYLPLNDLRDWTTDPDLIMLRDFLILRKYGTGPAHDSGYGDPLDGDALPIATRNWWLNGILVNSNQTPLLLVRKPCFGWAAYASEIVNRMQMTSHTTFFTHPNGTWAFYDQQRVYNRHGVPDIARTYSAATANVYPTPFVYPVNMNTPLNYVHSSAFQQMFHFSCPDPVFQFDAGLGHTATESMWLYYNSLTPVLEAATPYVHVVYDKVHIELYTRKDNNKVSLDLSFAGMYNTSVHKLKEQADDPLLQLEADSQHPLFTRLTYKRILKLRVYWQGVPTYLYEGAFRNCDYLHGTGSITYAPRQASMKALLSNPLFISPAVLPAPEYTFTPIHAFPVAFSTCILLGA